MDPLIERPTMKNLLAKLLLLVALSNPALLLAQNAGAPEGSKLSAAEIAVLRETLKEPPPLNGLQQNIDIYFRKMDGVAFRLGDMQERERILREWNQVSTNLDARWTYARVVSSSKCNIGLIRLKYRFPISLEVK